METESERSHRLEASRRYSAEKRARESEEKKAERRMMDRKRAADRRARESQGEREHRLALGRQRAAERRAAESEEERERRLAQNRERLASKRASVAEKSTLEAGATLPGDGPWLGVGMAVGGDLDELEQQRTEPTCFNGLDIDDAFFQDPDGAGLTITTTTSDPLLPVVTASSSATRFDKPCEVRDTDMMSGASVVQQQQEQQQKPIGATAEQTAAPSTSSGAAGGVGEKSGGEVKQEVLEIKEFRAGKWCYSSN